MRFLFFSLWLLLAIPSQVDAKCEFMDDLPVVDRTDTWNFHFAPNLGFYLPTRTIHGEFTTWAAAHFNWDGQVQVFFDFNRPDDQILGYAYNVHRIELDLVDEGFHYETDLTNNCTGAGTSFGPGSTAKLTPIKLPPLPGGGKRGKVPVRIRLWGKHA